MRYQNKKYYSAIKDYKYGNNSSLISELSLIIDDPSLAEEETFSFLEEAKSIASERNDERIIAYIKEAGNEISKFSGDSYGIKLSLNDVIKTDGECLKLIKESMKDDKYFVAISQAVEYIKRKKDFHIAYKLLMTIDEAAETSANFDKKDMAINFIEFMFPIIKNDIRPTSKGFPIKIYKFLGPGWTISPREFRKYEKTTLNYSKQYSERKTTYHYPTLILLLEKILWISTKFFTFLSDSYQGKCSNYDRHVHRKRHRFYSNLHCHFHRKSNRSFRLYRRLNERFRPKYQEPSSIDGNELIGKKSCQSQYKRTNNNKIVCPSCTSREFTFDGNVYTCKYCGKIWRVEVEN